MNSVDQDLQAELQRIEQLELDEALALSLQEANFFEESNNENVALPNNQSRIDDPITPVPTPAPTTSRPPPTRSPPTRAPPTRNGGSAMAMAAANRRNLNQVSSQYTTPEVRQSPRRAPIQSTGRPQRPPPPPPPRRQVRVIDNRAPCCGGGGCSNSNYGTVINAGRRQQPNLVQPAESTRNVSGNTTSGNTLGGAGNTLNGAGSTFGGAGNTLGRSGNTLSGSENTLGGSGNVLSSSGNTLGGGGNRLGGGGQVNVINRQIRITPQPVAQRRGGFTRDSIRDQQGRRVIRTRRFIVNGQPVNETETRIESEDFHTIGLPGITESVPATVSFQPMRLVLGSDDLDGAGYETLLNLEDHEPGAEQEEIQQLPEVELDKTIEEYECPVCMEPMKTKEIIRTLPCFHRLHKDCIDRWLEMRKTCPICKTSVA